MNTIFLRLEGPFQAWGLRARWGERDTVDAPTKSGLIGLLGCALGLRRENYELRQISDALRLGVRVDLPGTRLRDYHTTGGGHYGDVSHRGGTRLHTEAYVGGVLSAQVTSKGEIKVKINENTKEPETDVSERYYLADASFLAVLQGPPDLVTRLAKALQDPVWPYFLGRKACVPAEPIFDGVGEYGDLLAALTAGRFTPRVEMAWQGRTGRPGALRLLLEVGPGQGNRQYDNIDTPARRVFRPRYVHEVWLPLGEASSSAINTMEG